MYSNLLLYSCTTQYSIYMQEITSCTYLCCKQTLNVQFRSEKPLFSEDRPCLRRAYILNAACNTCSLLKLQCLSRIMNLEFVQLQGRTFLDYGKISIQQENIKLLASNSCYNCSYNPIQFLFMFHMFHKSQLMFIFIIPSELLMDFKCSN